MHGIYRTCEAPAIYKPIVVDSSTPTNVAPTDVLLHPKYKLSAQCFAYVGNANKPATWKLPFLREDGGIDEKRLPKAIQAILSNYRGAQVHGIPEADISAVLLRLARAAAKDGRMPPGAIAAAPVYQQLAMVMQQLGLNVG
ncbi:MAG: hypothetical protein ACREC1_05760 [Methylovirgula sp.]